MNVFGYHTPLGMASRERLKAFAEHAREDGDWQATAPHAVQALRDALRPLAQFLPQPSGKRITDAALALWHEVLRDDVAPGAFLDDEEGWGRFLARVQTLLEAIRDAGQPSLQAPPASTEGDDPALSASAFIEMAPMSSGAYQAANWAASLAPWAARSVGAGWMSSLAMFDGRDAFVVDSGKDGDALCLRVECMDRYQRVRWGEVRVHDYYRWSAIAAVEAANIAGASNPLREPASAASVLIRRAWSWEAFKGAHWRFSDGHESPEHF
jgi:hypothetical protein